MDELTDTERAIETMYKMAAIIKEYYDALIEQGFTKAEAMKLVTEWQKNVTTPRT